MDFDKKYRPDPQRCYRKTAFFQAIEIISYRKIFLGIFVLTGACAQQVTVPEMAVTVDSVFGPASDLQVSDGRSRFREIYCAVNEDHGRDLPDFRPCAEALLGADAETPASGDPVSLDPARVPLRFFVVLGLGANCIEPLIAARETVHEQVRSLGHRISLVPVEGLASTTLNARIIRDTVMTETEGDASDAVVLLGYSKGAPDILTAIASYPELAQRITAVVSVAGAIGGSPLADDSSQSQANLMAKIPGSGCDVSDEGAMADLRTGVRRAWLKQNELPDSIRYYSLITMPDARHISMVLRSAYKTLGEIDYRNDSQVIYYDQIIPRSRILAFLNADHLAIAVPVRRTHAIIGSTLINRNDFPREVLMESLIIYLQEDLRSVSGRRQDDPTRRR